MSGIAIPSRNPLSYLSYWCAAQYIRQPTNCHCTYVSFTGQANLQDKVDTLQDKLINLQDNLDTFKNITEAITRKSHHNVTEGLQNQLQSCNGTDISIQYLPTSCREIAELNPHSPPGYYKINSTSDAVYCSMTTPNNPASSCQDIATQHPLASSGYYWVNSSNGTAVQVYCDMERHCCGSTGGWMRAAYLNMTDPTHHCPTGFRLTSHPKRSCERITRPGCTGLIFPVHNEKYSKVCGKVIAYQYGGPDAFSSYHNNRALDATYVDGVSITHGHRTRHIWTFAAATDEGSTDRFRCPCSKIGSTYTGAVPPFVGNDYFCDTGSRNHWQTKFYSDDPLWDGSGCGSTSSCCSFNSPPWFCKELPQPTTDDIEVRVCTNYLPSYEDITIKAIELYVQ